jgi:hypothetical protein
MRSTSSSIPCADSSGIALAFHDGLDISLEVSPAAELSDGNRHQW